MNTSNRCMFLEKLPRKIRDKIYEFVLLGHGYSWACASPTKFKSGVPTLRTGFVTLPYADLSILCVCGSISQEAKDVLYSKGCFIIYFDVTQPRGLSKEVQNIAGRIQNMELLINMHPMYQTNRYLEFERYRARSDYLEEIFQEILAPFIGNDIARNLCHIRFWSCKLDVVYDYYILQKPFMESLQRLTGFKTLIVDVESPFHCSAVIKEQIESMRLHGIGDQECISRLTIPRPSHDLSHKEVKWWLNVIGHLRLHPSDKYAFEKEETRKFYRMVRSEIEPYYGPFTESKVAKTGTAFCGRMLFHPRQYPGNQHHLRDWELIGLRAQNIVRGGTP